MNEKRGETSGRPALGTTYRKHHRVNRRIQVVKELAEAIKGHVEGLDKDLEPKRSLPEADHIKFYEDIKFYEEVQHFEISLIEDALRQTSGHQRRAARLLGLKATTLCSLIKRYNICTKDDWPGIFPAANQIDSATIKLDEVSSASEVSRRKSRER